MPIARFAEWLERSGNYESYMQTLLDAFNPVAAENVMCRDLISIGSEVLVQPCDIVTHSLLVFVIINAAPADQVEAQEQHTGIDKCKVLFPDRLAHHIEWK